MIMLRWEIGWAGSNAPTEEEITNKKILLCIDELRALTGVEYAPVREGIWLEHDSVIVGGVACPRCSVCNTYCIPDKMCSNCGAKMKWEE